MYVCIYSRFLVSFKFKRKNKCPHIVFSVHTYIDCCQHVSVPCFCVEVNADAKSVRSYLFADDLCCQVIHHSFIAYFL